MTVMSCVRHFSALCGVGVLCAAVSGCSTSFISPAATEPPSSFAISGTAMGGSQPIANAKVYMYAAGAGGSGTVSRSMLTTAGSYVTTGNAGQFSIAGDFKCQSGDDVYLLAVGGNPGLSDPNANNAAITLAVPLGHCSALNSGTHVMINEATTVAMAYALAPFLSAPTVLVSNNTTQGKLGLDNAFTTASNLVDTTTGAIRSTTIAGTGTLPQDLINSLANSLAACVNSDGSSSSPCPSLFAATTLTNGSMPADVFTAALNVVHNPASSVSAVYKVAVGATPFQPSLPSAPHDWALQIDYTDSNGDFGSYSDGITPLAVDGLGRVWERHQSALQLTYAMGAFSPSYFTQLGGQTIGPMAVDASNNIWQASSNNGNGAADTVVEGDSGGDVLMQIFPTGMLNVQGMAFDSVGNLWTGSMGNFSSTTEHVAEYSPSGQILSKVYANQTGGDLLSNYYPEPYSASSTSLTASHALADISGDMWYGTDLVAPGGAVIATNNGSAALCGGLGQYQTAYDREGYLWGGPPLPPPGQGVMSPPTYYYNFLEKCTANGVQANQYSLGSTIVDAQDVVVDGDDHVWTFDAASTNPRLMAVNATDGTLLFPTYLQSDGRSSGGIYGLAIDPSGNIWIAGAGHLQQFVGIAAPVITPLAAAVAANALATRP